MKASLAAEDSPTRVSFGSVALLNAFLKRHTWTLAVFTEVAVIPSVGLWKDSLFSLENLTHVVSGTVSHSAWCSEISC